MRKGLSPLIAAVILIAATMTIAGIVSFWTTGFIKSRLREAENVTEGSACLGADFKFQIGRYEAGTLYFILENTRSVDLKIENLYLFYEGGTMKTRHIGRTLKANEIKEFNVTGITKNDLDFTKATIKTDCPGVTLSFTPDVIG